MLPTPSYHEIFPPLRQLIQKRPFLHSYIWIGIGLFLFFGMSLYAQPSVALLLPQNKHLPKDIRTQTVYDKSGQKIIAKYQYYHDHWSEQSIKHGLYTRWDQHGITRQEMEFVHGQLIHKIIRDTHGNIKREIHLKQNRLDGMQRRYYSQNRLRHETLYVKGKKEGLEKAYYPSGDIKWVRIYHNGQSQGPKMRYRKDGSLKQQRKEREAPLSPSKVEKKVQSKHSQVSSKS